MFRHLCLFSQTTLTSIACLGVGLPTVGLAVLSLPAVAQDSNAEAVEAIPSTRIYPRLNATHRSANGYHGDLGELTGFVPLHQSPGSLFFVEGTTQLENNAFRTGSISLGQRAQMGKALLGGYLSYDIRDSNNNFTFHQIGAGVELLGPGWDVRLNGYLPLDQSAQKLSMVLSDSYFQGDSLYVELSDRTEQALGSVELEAGLQLAHFGSGGQLWGYGGAYYQGNTLGGRARLDHTLQDRFQLGVGVQSDGIFGTRGFFSVGVSLGGWSNSARPTGSTSPADEETFPQAVPSDSPGSDSLWRDSLWQRAAAPIRRNARIVVQQQQRATAPQLALDTETGKALSFIHVTDGAVGGDGSFENPFGEVTDAIATTVNDDLIIVDSGDRSSLDSFTIPDTVQVLSTGVTQSLALEPSDTFGNRIALDVVLPGSDTGTLPLVQSTITVGNNTTLSGFEVQTTGDSEHGVYARNVSDTTIDRNQISTTGDDAFGVYALAEGETLSRATILGNTIITAGESGYGVYLSASNNGTFNQASFSDNEVSVSGEVSVGLLAYAENSSTIEDITVTDNTVIPGEEDSNYGIYLGATDSSTLNNSVITGNTVSLPGKFADGITVSIGNDSTGDNVTLANNNVTHSGRSGRGIFFYSRDGGTATNVSISGNTVSTTSEIGSQADGIAVLGRGGTIEGFIVSGNTVSTAGEFSPGISTGASDRGTASNIVVSGNTVSTTGYFSPSIENQVIGRAIVTNTTISGNTISTTGEGSNGIGIRTILGTLEGTTASDNIISTTGKDADGIQVSPGGASDLTLSNNTIATAGESADGIRMSVSKFGTSSVDATISGNLIQQAGQHSFSLSTLTSAGNSICIAEFKNNSSSQPNVFGSGGSDLNITTSSGSSVDFVNFSAMSTNNTGFDEITGLPIDEPTACP